MHGQVRQPKNRRAYNALLTVQHMTSYDVSAVYDVSNKIMKTSFKTITYAIMNTITTNITLHKCQCDAPFVIFVVLDAQYNTFI